MNNYLYIGYRDELFNPTEGTPDQIRAENQWNHPDTMFQLLSGGSGSGKTTRAVKSCIETAMQYPGMNQFWGHKQLSMFQPGPFKALEDIVPKTLVNIDGDMVWTIEYKNDQSSRYIILRIPGYIHPGRGYTAKITYWGLDDRHGWVEKLEKQGGSFGLGYFDQIDLLRDDSAFRAFITRFRTEPMKFIATTNPDKSGWWHKYWTDDPRYMTEQTKNYVKTVMNPSGNPHVHDKYEETMRATLSGDQKKRMVDGIDIYEGEQVFSEFDSRKNTINVKYPIPSDWILHEFWDYGWNDPANICLFGQTPNGNLILISILRRNRTRPKDVAREWLLHKDALIARGRTSGMEEPKIVGRWCDPRMCNNGGDGSRPVIEQIADYVHDTGECVLLSPTSLKRVRPNENIRLSQITAAKQLFYDRTLLVNTSDCDEFYEEIESYVWDEKTMMPKNYRKTGKGGVVIHHHDTMDNILKAAGVLYLPEPKSESEKANLGNGYTRVNAMQMSNSPVISAIRAFTRA